MEKGATLYTDAVVPIIIGGKELKLHFTLGAIRDLLRDSGGQINILAGFDIQTALHNPDLLLQLFKAGLKRHQPAIEDDFILDNLDMGNIGPNFRALLTAMSASQGPADDEDVKPKSPPADPTSGQTDAG